MGKTGRSKKLLTRRKFIEWLGYLTIIHVLYLWIKLIKRNDIVKREKELTIPAEELSEGFNIFNNVIIVKSENNTEVFSSSCTHLGCSINQIDNDTLVCPCHGSRYDMQGKPVKGPSVKSLKKLKYVINDETNEIIISLVS